MEVRWYLTLVKTVISSKGQIVIPSELREMDRVIAGQQFSIERIEAGSYILRRLPPEREDLVDWLQACPEHDWFEPITSESTDSL